MKEQLMAGDRLDRYVIEEHLGSGGMGAVYRARHATIGQLVCIKVLKSSVSTDPQMVQRFLREAQMAAATGSPHIVQVYDFATTEEGQPFLVMEHLAGHDLEVELREKGKLPLDRALDIAQQILEAVGAAHDKRILHRDLKPANVFLVTTPDGSDEVKLLDFGIGKVMGDASAKQLTQTGMLMGTPYYMSPEQFAGAKDVGPRGDLYSVAAIVYEMLTGVLPYDGDSLSELLTKITSERPAPLRVLAPGLPRGVVSAVERGLAKDPEERYASAAEMGAALHAAASRVGSAGAGASSEGRPQHWLTGPTLPPTMARSHAPVGSPAKKGPAAQGIQEAERPSSASKGRDPFDPLDPMAGPSVALAPGAPPATTSGKGAVAAGVGLLMVSCLPLAIAAAVIVVIAVAIFFMAL